MSSPVVTNNVIDVPVVNDKKTKKPRAPKTVATTEPVAAAAEIVSESVATEPKTDTDTDTVKDKKTKKPRAPKTVATEPVVAEPAVTSEPAVTTEPAVTSESAVTTEKKKREPGLPAKYAKFLQFGFYLAEALKDTEGNININSYHDFINKLNLFDTVDNQASFVQKFFDQSKDINKSIKKMVTDKKKADAKAAKLAAKPTKKNTSNKNKTNDNNINLTNDNDFFVSEVVSLANPNTKPKPKRKYNKKNNNTPTNNIVNVNQNVNQNQNQNQNVNNLPRADDDALDVEIIVFNDTNFLVDANKRIFDFNYHNLIGHIDSNNLLVLY